MKKWKCTVCGEIVESETRPEICPRCKVPGEKFVLVEEGAELENYLQKMWTMKTGDLEKFEITNSSGKKVDYILRCLNDDDPDLRKKAEEEAEALKRAEEQAAREAEEAAAKEAEEAESEEKTEE